MLEHDVSGVMEVDVTTPLAAAVHAGPDAGTGTGIGPACGTPGQARTPPLHADAEGLGGQIPQPAQPATLRDGAS